MSEKRSYKVLSRLRFDRMYEPGESVKMDAETAAPLIGSVLEDANPEDGARTDIILKAMDGLDKENPDHFTVSGKPEVRVLREITGFDDLTASDRDVAWEISQKAKG